VTSADRWVEMGAFWKAAKRSVRITDKVETKLEGQAMPYTHDSMARHNKKDFIKVVGFESPPEKGPGIASLLIFGRERFDRPGERTEMTDAMRAQVPRVLHVEQPQTKDGVPDFFDCGLGYLVSERFKTKLQHLEPDAHEFFPVKVVRDDTKESLGTHYLLYLFQKPDIIDHDNTVYGAKGSAIGGDEAAKVNFNFTRVRTDSNSVTGAFLINFKPGGYEGRHLWRGTVGKKSWHVVRDVERFPGGKSYSDPLERVLFFSDAFGAFFISEKMTGLHLEKILEKPISWYHESKANGLVR